MDFLARKITPGKWRDADPQAVERIAADVITSELRTQGNTLSFWACGSPSSEGLMPVALALAAVQARLDNIDVLWVPLQVVTAAGFGLAATPGQTPVDRLRSTHRDVYGLDHAGLGRVAGVIAHAIRSRQYLRFRRQQVCQLLADAVVRGELPLHALSDAVREGVEEMAGR